MIINSEAIKPGDQLKVLKKSEAVEEPPSKKFKAAAPNKLAKGRK